MLQNAATYLFAGLSAMIAVGLATWQVRADLVPGSTSRRPPTLNLHPNDPTHYMRPFPSLTTMCCTCRS